MKNYATVVGATKKSHVSKVPQTQPLAGTNQQANNGGGFSFVVDEWKQLERFLIIGSEGGSYYVSEKNLTVQNTKNLDVCLKDGKRLVDTIVAISDAGRAIKNDPAIFALAYAAAKGSPDIRQYAFRNMPKVARTSTDMFSFVEQYKQLQGGFGVVPKKGIGAWYTDKPIDSLALQLVKYRQRDGWTHHDVLSLAHVKASSPEENQLYAYAKFLADGDKKPEGPFPRIIEGYELIKEVTDAKVAAKLITDYKLPRETVPTQLLNSVEVWGALLPHMGATAVVRNLAKMTSVGLIAPFSDGEKLVREKLTDIDFLRRGRIHPLSILYAAKVYDVGHGERGNLTWKPSQIVLTALDDAFYGAFPLVQPTGKNIYQALDVSGSMAMEQSKIAGTSMYARDVAAAVALVTVNVEPNVYTYAFSNGITPFAIKPSMRLSDVMKKMERMPFSSTDCAAPFLHAMRDGIGNVDVFETITDSETNGSSMHPSMALKQYRHRHNPKAKCVVLATTATKFSIADPNDAGMLDIAGFDSNVPLLLADFLNS
jgi:60 kDa SS-A/Ro ribonucleoprotein